MSFSFGFYNSMNHDRLYDAIQVSRIFDGIIRDGVYATIGDAFIVQASQEPNLVVIGPGRAWFNHTWNENDGYLDFDLPSSETVIDRIDALVIDVDSRPSVRTNRFLVVKGTPSSSPKKPTLIKNVDHAQYPIAYILRRAAVNKIAQADIENAVGTSECPFVTGVLETIDTDLLLLQWRNAWDRFIDECEAHLAEWEDDAKEQVANFITEFERQCNEYLAALERRCNTIVSDTEAWQTEQERRFDVFYTEFKQQLLEYEKEISDLAENIKEIVTQDDVLQLLDDLIQLRDDLTVMMDQMTEDVNHMKDVVAGFEGKVTTFSADGKTVTETLDDGTKIVTKFLENGNIETERTPSNGRIDRTKLTEFKEDGSIVETVIKTEYYGFNIDQNDSNPATRVSYPSGVDNSTWEPMTVNLTTGEYDLKNWKNAFFIRNARPVMLKYDGTVAYELDHSDQTKKLDGTPSDISNPDFEGNAMVEFPKIYFARMTNNLGPIVRISNKKHNDGFKCYQHMYNGKELDHIYLPMFEGSSINGKVRSIAGQTPMNNQSGPTEKTQIEANGAGWQFDDWMNAQMITHLLFLIGKTTDVQAVFGNGHHTGGTSAASLLQTGTLKNKGMFYGSSGNVAVKFFWLENYYGDRWDRKYGVVYGTDGKIKVKPYPPYNIDGSGYVNTGLTITGTNGGYISKTKMTEYGEFPIEVNGSETTYIPDGCWWDQARLNFLFWGAACHGGRHVGVSFYVYSPFSGAYWSIGPSLAYKRPQ